MAERVIIIGAGHAGTSAARSLRDGGWTGEVVILSNELSKPYERPPLSKEFLSNTKSSADILINPPEWMEANHIQFRAGDGVESINVEAHTVQTKNAKSYHYDYLILATGSSSFTPDIPGIARDGVFSRRSLDQALTLRDRLSFSQKVVIIGGGLIGLEVAATATKIPGLDTTVIERASTLLPRLLPETVSSQILEMHRQNGTTVVLDATVVEIVGTDKVEGVKLSTGKVVEADTVLVAVGALPETALAKDAGLAVDTGVVVDEYLQTSNQRVYAAGDISQFPANGGSHRLESWKNALDQGAAVAASILGQKLPFKAVPWMWSDQFDKVIQVAGIPDPSHIEVRRVLNNGGIMTFHLSEDGTLRAATAFGDLSQVANSIRVSTSMIEKELAPEMVQLADPSSDLRAMLRAIVARNQEAPIEMTATAGQ